VWNSGFFVVAPALLESGAVVTPEKEGAFAAAADPTALRKLREWEGFEKDVLSANTWRALYSDIRQFDSFCARVGASILPADPKTIRAFLLESQSRIDGKGVVRPRSLATLRRYLSSIAIIHRAADLESPCDATSIRKTLKAIARRIPARQRQAQAFGFEELQRYLAVPTRVLRDLRDRALVALAYDTLTRSDELARAQVNDLVLERGVATLLIRRSKTDQVGDGAKAFVSQQTFDLIGAWLTEAKINHGPLFRAVSPHDVISSDALSTAAIRATIKRATLKIGVNPAGYSGHSTRVGAAQDLLAAGASLEQLKQAGRWKDFRMPTRYTENIAVERGAMAALAVAQGRHKPAD
jgi:site-specific recombinase XerD